MLSIVLNHIIETQAHNNKNNNNNKNKNNNRRVNLFNLV